MNGTFLVQDMLYIQTILSQHFFKLQPKRRVKRNWSIYQLQHTFYEAKAIRPSSLRASAGRAPVFFGLPPTSGRKRTDIRMEAPFVETIHAVDMAWANHDFRFGRLHERSRALNLTLIMDTHNSFGWRGYKWKRSANAQHYDLEKMIPSTFSYKA